MKETESSGIEISTSGQTKNHNCRSAPKTITGGSHESVCEREIESFREKQLCVSKKVSLLEWEMINLSKGLQRGETRRNLGSV